MEADSKIVISWGRTYTAEGRYMLLKSVIGSLASFFPELQSVYSKYRNALRFIGSPNHYNT
jgi:hypothetical protein